jgi:hypothetical protein
MNTALKFSSLRVHQFVQEQVESTLKPHGFVFDLARGLWTRSLPSGIEHLVTLPTDIAGNHGPVVVTANLGVHFRPLVRALAHPHDPRRAHNLATFTRNVGQLSAKRAWRDWIIRDVADAERIARRLAARVVSVGLPWLTKFDCLAAVCDGFRTFGREDHRQHSVPRLEQMLAAEANGDAATADRLVVGGEPAILSLHINREEFAWHCDD